MPGSLLAGGELAGRDDGFVAAGHLQLDEDLLEVPLDRLHADVQRQRNPLVRHGLFEQRKHLLFAPGESRRGGDGAHRRGGCRRG
jgi:hypothetical protein